MSGLYIEMIERDLKLIESNVKLRLTKADIIKFGVYSQDIEIIKKYFKDRDYDIKILSESLAISGIEPGIRPFKHYAIVSRRK